MGGREVRRGQVSIVTPAFNEAGNLLTLYERLCRALDTAGADWEWIIVDDHSADETFAIVRRLTAADPRVRGVRFAHNFGSHAAVACGLSQSAGDCAVVMAADLQDPPETLPTLVTEWRRGAQVVWAVRQEREGEARSTVGFARAYYWLMRHLVRVRQMPATGADFVLLDRRAVDAVGEFRESNVSLLAVLGFVYAAVVVVNAIEGRPVQGWSSLMIAVLVVGGVQMLMMGILGEYVWRALDEARRRPRYLIEATTDGESDAFDPPRVMGSSALRMFQ